MTTIHISNVARIEVCDEIVEDHLPRLNYCIDHIADAVVRANLITIRDELPKYVQGGNTEIVSIACGFIKETYDDLIRGKGAASTQTRALGLLAEINKLISEIGKKNDYDDSIAAKLKSIVQPINSVRMFSTDQFIIIAEQIIVQLKSL